ncbi:CaiB/BaiF CoA-transferase family protein [Domibacillus sp. DTU_2020_1001157_1_SI_ALB_TIR_016]|uniref:CaiB/BaiF CoA transferase family protein n=1 Tax=Domibacillus sp. DTU_2020_1001157_1_SI_ALB_TIR_016 TaxID=3077789 RepID=UPI0028EC6E0C|nr:CaiB/BaiF CoA-transferase family protein [Domibacillus sp. DTU_2020_1001157_1_SI_ALB_TIR_016]WNS79105.1 CaiB/BaiF CoA-transferase family protein [Domibacillus sp. DTU_2020_1001157_1_SI_ALB_TIR_016]
MAQINFGPLTGLKIIDVSSVIAAPFAACLLGDLGAEVIKVELPGKGDATRGLGPWKDEESLRWPGLSRNKRSLTLDIRTEEGREIFKELVRTADAVIENFRPGTLEKWGLGYEVLKEVNPNIVLTRQSGYGQTGPYAGKAGFGTPCTAFSGYTYLQGFSDRPPVSPAFSLLDYVSGIFVAFGTVSALYHRDKNNAEGQVVELGLYEAMFRMMEFLIAEHDQLGKVRERSPMLAGHSSPAGTYQTKDGKWVVLVCSTEKTWTRLAESMGRADLIDDPRYKTNMERMQNDEDLQKIVKEFIGSLNNDELLEKMDTEGVPVSPILSIEDIFNNPQYKARENILEVEHPRLGSVKVPGIVPKFSATPGKIRHRAPDLGEHNEEILRNEIGLTEEQIAQLYEKGVI